jgi:hypothetical protein
MAGQKRRFRGRPLLYRLLRVAGGGPAFWMRRVVRRPMQRVLLGVDAMVRPQFALPRQPWRAAAAGADGGEVVAEFPGAFEPMRRMPVYGGQEPEAVGETLVRDSTLRLRRYRNVIVLPHHVILSAKTGEVLPPTFDLRSSMDEAAVRPTRDGRHTYKLRGSMGLARAVDQPVFLADSIFRAYGHSLMEILPKLAMLAAAPADAIVATSGMVLPELFAAMGATPERLLRIDRPLFCDAVYVPDPPLDLGGNIHSLARQCFRDLRAVGERSTIEVPGRIYLSRRGVKARRLENEAEMEELFQRRGFTLVQPELLSLPDQVRLMSQALAVAGPGGSAMHNLMFSPPTTKALFVLSPHWYVVIDRYVALADDQFGAVFGMAGSSRQGDMGRHRTWRVDLDVVNRAITAHFGS